MAADAGDRPQLGFGQMPHFQSIVGDAEIQVGLARQQQHLRLDRAQRLREIVAVERVGADVAMRPGDELRVEIGGVALLERGFPVGFQIGLQVRCAEGGEMQALAVKILTQRPAGIDMAHGAQRADRRRGETAIADMLRRRLEGAQQASARVKQFDSR